MKRIPTSIFVVVVMCSAVAAAAGEKKQQDRAASERASCVLRVSYDPNIVTFNSKIVTSLIESTGVSAAAIEEVFGMSASEVPPRTVTINYSELPWGNLDRIRELKRGKITGDAHVQVGQLTVDIEERPDDREVDVQELMLKVCEKLENAFMEASMLERQMYEEHLARAKAEVERARAQLQQLHDTAEKLRQRAGRSQLDRNAVLAELQQLEEKERGLDSRLVALRAHRQAVTEQIAKIAGQVEVELEHSDIAGDLKEVIRLREQQIKLLTAKAEEGLTTPAALIDVQEALAEARVRYAEYRNELAASAGDDVLEDLNQRLVELSIEAAEVEAELEFVRNQLAEAANNNLRELANTYEREVHLRERVLEHNLEEAMATRQHLKRRLDTLFPTRVTVIGGAAAK